MKTIISLLVTLLLFQLGFSQSIVINPNNTVAQQSSNNNITIQSNAAIDIKGIRHNSLFNSPTAVAINNTMMRITGSGHNGSDFTSNKAQIDFTASENWTPSATGSQMKFWTNANGTSAMLERMIIANDGNVGINTSNPDSKLHIVGDENNGTTAGLKISSPGANMIMDGNEIDSDVPLFLNYNSNKDVYLAKGGGLTFIGNNGTGIKEIIKETVSIPSFNVSANNCYAAFVTVTNVSPQSTIYISPELGMAAGLFIAYARYSSANIVGIRVCNVTTSLVTQPTMDFHVTAIK